MAAHIIVVKRNGSESSFSEEKLRGFLNELKVGLNTEFLNINELTEKVAISLPDKIGVNELYEFVAELLASRTIQHPDYALLAGRVEAIKIQKIVGANFLENIKLLYGNVHPKTKKHTPLVSKEVYDTVIKHPSIEDIICSERDMELAYFGVKTLERSYLLHIHERGIRRVAETPQYLFLRVALGIHGDDIPKVRETYELMSQKYFIHASPTLFNSGTGNNYLSSCFLLAMEDDSIHGIYKTLHKTALISKASGGIGLHVHNIRANGALISSSDGSSSGLVPMLRVFNNTARYVDQGGNKRPGAFAIFLEPWHADIFDVLDLRKNYGNEERRARDLFYGLWVPDLFMERVKSDGDWCLFTPDECPGLLDCYGEEFTKLYEKYEKQGNSVNTIKAQELWKSIIESQIETGSPYMLYKDSCNTKSNQKHLGTIKSSNLCCEIIEYTSKDETAVCNLGSLALPLYIVEDDEHVYFDFKKLHQVTKILARNLDRVIDVTKYPIESARYSNLRHRPIAIGVQGLADVFARCRFPFESEQAQVLNIQIFETIYHAAIEASIELAEVEGQYESFQDSPASEGLLQFDMWNHKPSALYDDWDSLKLRIVKHGLRNSLLVAPMPTASTSQILGFNECFEPFTSNIYTRRVMSGEFQVVNKYLVNDLIDLGLWTPAVKDLVLVNGGSIQNIPEIPANIKQLYKTVWEISQKKVIDMATDRAKFIDQLQSMNIYMKDPTHRKLTSCHFYSWSKGLKTGMYYLRTQAASRAIQFTVEDTKTPTPLPKGNLKRKSYVFTESSKRAKLDSSDQVRRCIIGDSTCDSCSG